MAENEISLHQGKHALVIFDGYCNFCNNTVNFLIKRDKHDRFRFTPRTSSYAQKLEQELGDDFEAYNSILYFTNGKIYAHSTGALKMFGRLGGVYSFMRLLLIIPSFLRNIVYKYISRNRYKWFGKRDSCMIPTEADRQKFLM